VNCERCGQPGQDIEGAAVVCRECLVRIVREWQIRDEEFRELADGSLSSSPGDTVPARGVSGRDRARAILLGSRSGKKTMCWRRCPHCGMPLRIEDQP
jgi:uncharacterized protein (UPF0212 family)